MAGLISLTRPSSRIDIPTKQSGSKDNQKSLKVEYTEASLRPIAEQRFQAFVSALDRGDEAVAYALVSKKQRDSEFLYALSPVQLRSIADWYRTYEFGGVWGDRVEFRATRLLDGRPMSSVYVHFAPGEEGITY